MSARQRTVVRVGLALLLAGIAWLFHEGRREFVRGFFRDAPPGDAPWVRETAGDGAGVARASHVRVVLLDGLRRDHAARLPALTRLCAGGLDLVVDAGFPTVSLPVQHVLWTGLTQQQSGIQYRVTPLETSPAGIPRAVPGSIAVAESHEEIVHSFGFTRALPPRGGGTDPVWRATGFEEAARTAVASDAALAFLHVLRVDEAGHAGGAASPEYRDAAASADAWLTRWIAARPDAAWIVLADHGHRDEGGHGGAEEVLRRVRACVRAPGIAAASGELHLVDLSRLVADLLAVPLAPEAVGRSLTNALAAPRPEATLPRLPDGRIALVVACTLVVVIALLRGTRAPLRAWPWWWCVAVAALVWRYDGLGLSVPAVYSPLGRDLALAAWPGWLVLLAQLVALRTAPRREVLVVLAVAPSWIAAIAGVALCAGPPWLWPVGTSQTSAALVLAAVASAAAALVLLVGRRRAA